MNVPSPLAHSHFLPAGRLLRIVPALLAGLTLACSSPTPPDDEPDAAMEEPVDAATPTTDAAPPPPPPPLFSHTRGFYTDPFELVLSSPYSFADVAYTLDGSDPAGPDGVIYDAPISINTTAIVRAVILVDGEMVSSSETHTFIFADHITSQQAPAGYPNEWWSLYPYWDPGTTDPNEVPPWPADYQMDPDVYNDPRALAYFPDTFLQVTAVSVVLKPEELFGIAGIHENAWLGGKLWERAGSLELFEPQDPDNNVQVNCAISVHGASSRRPERTAKKSFRAEFKSRYGASKLNYKVFDDSPVEEFDVLVLRGGYNRTWTHYGASQRTRSAYVREAFGAELQRAMGHAAPRARHAQMFLNGLYWGVTWIQERPNAAFQASYFGGSKGDYDSLNSGRIVDGDRVAWDHMMAIVEFGLDTPEAYAALHEWLDVENFADYMILNQWMGNIDWPDRNWYAGRHRSDEGRFRFFSWDAEITLGNINLNILNDRDFPDTPGRIFERARVNSEFVVYFGDRIHRHLFNDGVLTPAATVDRWNVIAAVAEPLVYGESARWGDHWRDERMAADGEFYTPWEHWANEQERMRTSVFPVRTDIMIQQYRDSGLYPLFDAPTLSLFGGEVPAGFMLDMIGSAADRDIYYTLDGSDPRMPGGTIGGTAMLYGGPVPINGDVTVKARMRLQSGEWSALVETQFTVQ